MEFNTILIAILGVIMIIAAFIALYTRKLLAAIIISGAISLLASVLYVVMAAPDVAMTEAAIGSGLTTIVFLFAFNKIKNKKDLEND